MDNEKLIAQNEAYKLQESIAGCKYRHFKGGIYEVMDVVVHSETNELMVIYRSVNAESDYVWARPYCMFVSEVDHEKYPDVKQRFRFEKI